MACLESARAAIPSLANPEPVESRVTSQLPTPTASPITSQLPNPTASHSSSQLPAAKASPSSSPAEDEGDESEEEEEDDGPVVPRDLARCPRCLRSFPKELMADHRKTHLLRRVGIEGQLVSRSSACTHCRRRGHRCIVAKHPSHEGLRTVRCLQCLVDRECCSFAKTYRHLDVGTLSEHPAAGLR